MGAVTLRGDNTSAMLFSVLVARVRFVLSRRAVVPLYPLLRTLEG